MYLLSANMSWGWVICTGTVFYTRVRAAVRTVVTQILGQERLLDAQLGREPRGHMSVLRSITAPSELWQSQNVQLGGPVAEKRKPRKRLSECPSHLGVTISLKSFHI